VDGAEAEAFLLRERKFIRRMLISTDLGTGSFRQTR
jgi:hypothetical protein